MKPVTSNRGLLLSRVSDSLQYPAVVLKKCCYRLAEITTYYHSAASEFVQHHMSVWNVLMTIDLDHVIVPTHNRSASAKMLAELLGVRWAGAGPFSAVYVNANLTLDFVETEGTFAPHHYCFRVDEAEFNAIVSRLKNAGIKYRSTPRGPEDMQINSQLGSSNIYWNEPDGHQWEILTVDHAVNRKELMSC
ncbi:MAG: VOC family protein [Pseudomonadota bacterium]